MTESPIHFTAHVDQQPIPHPHTAQEPCPGGCADIEIIASKVSDSHQRINALNERIEKGHDQLTRLESRLEDGDSRMGRIELSISSNATKLDLNSIETSEILGILREGKAFFRFARRIGEFIKWVAIIGTAIAGFYYAVKGGK